MAKSKSRTSAPLPMLTEQQAEVADQVHQSASATRCRRFALHLLTQTVGELGDRLNDDPEYAGLLAEVAPALHREAARLRTMADAVGLAARFVDEGVAMRREGPIR